jgi:protein-L-isoaspartate(D-aspartate) O-methyltransferase
VEATAGIEPAYTDLQSAASPLRHVANEEALVRVLRRRQHRFGIAYIGAQRERQCLTARLPFGRASRRKQHVYLPEIAMIDYATARRHMVDGQVHTADVTDLRILFAMQEVPRERFVPPQSASLAYLDLDLPIGSSGRRLLKPMVLSKLLQAADIASTDRVLDVGCATGYAAALLGRMAEAVIALEEDPDFVQTARAELASLPNIRVVNGPLVSGWVEGKPYDIILLEGATDVAPQILFHQLANGGRLVCVLGSGPAARAMLYNRSGSDIGGRAIFDATAAVLPGFTQEPIFAF